LEHKVIRLKIPPLYDFTESLWFLDRNLDDCMHKVLGDKARKMVTLDNKNLLIEISSEKNDLVIKVLNGGPVRDSLVIGYVDEWLDYTRDIRPFYRLLENDKDLSALAVNFRGFRVVGIPDLFETLCWCVLGQQINLEFAYRLKRRLVERYGTALNYEGINYYVFPSPGILKEVPVSELRAMQITTRKAEYLRGISALFDNGSVSKKKLAMLRSEARMKEELIKIRGIGEWTANYAVMKSLRGMNCIPYGDAGINIALNRLKNIPKKNNRKEIDSVFNNFEGWKSYLVYYLWRSLRQPG
jgi:DNA-3-methyladenine glycosylase II